MNNDVKFELEQDILDVWHVVDDLNTICQVRESQLDNDAILNMLTGLKTLYALKFEKLFDTFERYTNKESSNWTDFFHGVNSETDPLFDVGRQYATYETDSMNTDSIDTIDTISINSTDTVNTFTKAKKRKDK